MSLKQQLTKHIMAAMKASQKQELEVLRYLMAKVKNVEIDQGEQSDQQIQQIISKQIKEMDEAIRDYQRAGRQDLIESDSAKIAILQKYLPEPMTTEQLNSLIDEIIAKNPDWPLGQVIGAVTEATAGQANGGQVAQLVRSKLQ
ncbi:MAG: glutamyl-tRNA amidotransferase [Candidatus Pacebacteria bacterium CG_4_10_14_0_8_um_filter_43_12]|nr:MAG: glutamyl-tRNA amidotransferase [Candidatus Pacebacteria bacterium CG10_big_fil_rev_8_21_14_0_10_44_11]PIY79012.1 MAG: glutamyl-tRNA amidotransferase [Candidatus Pacebacteria bacterium CG_4_10_14_0_8_um_filter_43_12]